MGLLGEILFGPSAGGSTGCDAVIDASCIYFWILEKAGVFAKNDELELFLTLGSVSLACQNIAYQSIGGIPMDAIVISRAIESKGTFEFVGFETTCLRVAGCVYENRIVPAYMGALKAGAFDSLKDRWSEASCNSIENDLALLKRCGLEQKVPAEEGSICMGAINAANVLRESIRMIHGRDLIGKDALPRNSLYNGCQDRNKAEELYREARRELQKNRFNEARFCCRKALELAPQFADAKTLLDQIYNMTPKKGVSCAAKIIKCPNCGKDVSTASRTCWSCDALVPGWTGEVVEL